MKAMLRIAVSLFVGFLLLMLYACMVASSDADRLEERYLMLHPPDNGGDER